MWSEEYKQAANLPPCLSAPRQRSGRIPAWPYPQPWAFVSLAKNWLEEREEKEMLSNLLLGDAVPQTPWDLSLSGRQAEIGESGIATESLGGPPRRP